MDKKKIIKHIYAILLLREDVDDPKSRIKKSDYLNYLDNLEVNFLRAGIIDIYKIIRGLKYLGVKTPQSIIRRIVFDTIGKINRGEIDGV